MTTLGDERIYPSARLVVDIMDAAGGRSEDEVIACLRYLREERGLHPGTKRGPRHFSWFKTVVADYFAQKRDREYVTGNGPVAAVAGALHDGDPGMIDLGMAASRTMRQLLVGASTRNSNGCAIGRPRSRGGRLLEVWDHPWPHKYKSPPRQKPGGPVGKEPDATWC